MCGQLLSRQCQAWSLDPCPVREDGQLTSTLGAGCMLAALYIVLSIESGDELRAACVLRAVLRHVLQAVLSGDCSKSMAAALLDTILIHMDKILIHMDKWGSTVVTGSYGAPLDQLFPSSLLTRERQTTTHDRPVNGRQEQIGTPRLLEASFGAKVFLGVHLEPKEVISSCSWNPNLVLMLHELSCGFIWLSVKHQPAL